MPVPWWQRIIDPEALVALVVLVALFGAVAFFRRWRVVVTCSGWIEGPWPFHVALDLFRRREDER